MAGLVAAAHVIVGREPRAATAEEARTVKIRMKIEGGAAITGALEEGRAARDFASLLPLKLTLTDYNATEKISDLPRRLSKDGAPRGVDPDVRDITYYAPWGNLALFYKDFGYSEGLVRIGRFDSGVEALRGRDKLRVTFEVLAD